jgi:hypothetical protein
MDIILNIAGIPMKLKEKGRITLRDPYVIPDALYELQAISLASDLLQSGVDLYTQIYQQAGIAKNKAQEHLSTDPTVYTLRSPDGVVYALEEAILSVDTQSFTLYDKKALLVSLGQIPKETDLSDYQNHLKDVTIANLGINPEVVLETISGALAVPNDEHLGYMEKRESAKSSTPTLSSENISLKDHNVILQTQVRALVEFIRHYLKSCCNTSVCWTYLDDAYKSVQYAHSLDHYAQVEAAGGNPFTGETNAYVSYLRRWTTEEIS